MPVAPSVRVALYAVAVVVVAACNSKEPVGETASLQQPLSQTQNQYVMQAGDSIGPVCVHLDNPYSVRICPDSAAVNYFLPADVTAETLVVHARGRVIRIALPNRTDAVFLTRSAMSTFLLRHYDATDTAAAADLRAYMGSGRYRAP